MVTKETKLWDGYWKRGELHSCVSASDDRQQQEINEFWVKFFSNFQDDTALLDIGTGNGLLPLLAVQYANEQNYGWEVHGVDLADINPVRDVSQPTPLLEQINFQGRIAAEDLPFEDEYFDVLTSQYAIEYSDMMRSLSEVARVLKKGGEFCAVLHCHDSLVVRQNSENIREADYLLVRDGMGNDIFSQCSALFERIFAGEEVENMVDRYQRLVRGLSDNYPARDRLNIIPKMQHALLEILKLSGKYQPDQVLEMVEAAQSRLIGMKEILQTLVAAALDEGEIKAMLSQLKELNFEILLQESFHLGGGELLLGHAVRARKL